MKPHNRSQQLPIEAECAILMASMPKPRCVMQLISNSFSSMSGSLAGNHCIRRPKYAPCNLVTSEEDDFCLSSCLEVHTASVTTGDPECLAHV
eukprot:scaffold114501_cov19-Prasinocladus_malaysianus.AAC.1